MVEARGAVLVVDRLRLVESGVRFVELTHDNLDHHAIVAKLMPSRCAQIDRPIAGLLECARCVGLAARRLDLRNSGDTAGPRHRVVGYGAWAFGAA